MAFENCILVAPNYGTAAVRAQTLGYGITITAEEDTHRAGRTFYPREVKEAPFRIGLVYGKWADYTRISNWLRGYLVRSRDIASAMRVVIPSRGFDRYGILSSSVPFGDSVPATSWKIQLSFEGAADPKSVQDALVAKFVLPANDTEHAPFFYPGAIQLSGNSSAGDALGVFDPGVYGLPASTNPSSGGGGGVQRRK
jgi:hypothetical protein